MKTHPMTIEDRLKTVFNATLHLSGRSADWDAGTPLLGSLPELDSLAVVGVISAIENEFGFKIEDEEINAEMLASVGSLSKFVERKLGPVAGV